MALKRKTGVKIRTMPDWFSGNLYFGQFTGGTVAAYDEFLALYNDSNDGSLFLIWDMTVTIGRDKAGAIPFCSAAGQIQQGSTVSFGVSQPVGASIFYGQSSTAGIFWQDTNPPGLSFTQYTFLDDAGSWRWNHNFPFAVLQPGFSYVVEILGTNSDCSISMVFERARSY